MQVPLTYLALGDSYTIGESVLLSDNFPFQLTKLLEESGREINPPRIIAKTGWTTDELENGIKSAKKNELIIPPYDFVTLLIGVNDQYRERNVEEYKPAFNKLLEEAIKMAGNRPAHVVVLSIPDWGVTPYAEGRDKKQIAYEIDLYNSINRKSALQSGVHYIDITPWTREAAEDPSLLAPDGLHPSGREYKRWAEKIAPYIIEITKRN